MADEPPSDFDLVLCTDPDCSVAWAFKHDDGRHDLHYHPRPHGPERPTYGKFRDLVERARPDWERFGLTDKDPP